jgi:large subunit ribosomal protein L1
MVKEENFLKAIEQLRKTDKKRNFDQTIDLIVNLKNFNVKKDSFTAFVQVPNKVKEKKVAGFFEKKSDAIDTITKEEFPGFKEKKDLKKLVKDYDFFIANAKLMPAVATNFGRVLGPAGKMPSPQLGIVPVESTEAIKAVLGKINSSVRIRVKEPSVKVGIGKQSLTDEQILKNAVVIYRKIVEGLPKKEEHVKSILIKLCMDKPIKVEF